MTSPEPGQTADQPQPQPTPRPSPQLQPESLTGARPLSLQDKLQLNRRAKKHGLPALWPEAERDRLQEVCDARFAGAAKRLIERMQHDLFFSAPSLVTEPPIPNFIWRGLGLGLQGDPSPAAAYSSPWGVAGALGDPAFGRTVTVSLERQMAAPPSGLYTSLRDDTRAVLRSFFSRLRGPIPW